MKRYRQFLIFSAILALLAALYGCNGKANNQPASASKFIGTWKVSPESEIHFLGGPVTFNEDFTYSAQRSADPSSPTITGPFTVSRDEKLFLGGELKKFGEEGMTVDGEGRIKLTKGGRTIYFIRITKS